HPNKDFAGERGPTWNTIRAWQRVRLNFCAGKPFVGDACRAGVSLRANAGPAQPSLHRNKGITKCTATREFPVRIIAALVMACLVKAVAGCILAGPTVIGRS